MVDQPNEGFTKSAFWNTARFYLSYAVLLGLILFLDFQIPLGVAVDVLYILVVLLSFWSNNIRATILVAIVSSVLTAGAFFCQPLVAEMWKVIFNRLIAIFAIWVTALLIVMRKWADEKRNKAILEREEALRKIRILHGLLPICASCKKIRNDKGYWEQMEMYIRDHSEAEFSHGICPECAERLYPEYYKKK
jgi:hypothetical protein